MARDLGDNGNDKVTLDWAFGDYRYRNWLGFRVGKMKKAFGLYNQIRDIDAARNGVFLPLGVYPEDARIGQQSIKGVALYGAIPGGLDYQIQYGTLDSDFEELIMDNPDILSKAVADDNYILHLGWNTPLDGLKVVGAYNSESWFQSMEVDMGMGPEVWETDVGRDAWVGGLEYMIGDMTCAAEYSQAAFEMNTKGYPPYEWTAEAYYGLLAYRFTDWLELGASYSVIYGDKDDKDGERYDPQGLPRALAWSKDLAITTRFDLSESWIVKLEGHWFNGLYATTTDGGLTTLEDYGEDPSEDGFLGAVKVTFSF
jgi:hypothetical protein